MLINLWILRDINLDSLLILLEGMKWLTHLLRGIQIKAIKETSLSANQGKNEMKKMSWNIEHDTGSEYAPIRGGPVGMSSLAVELGPMEIRTFVVIFWIEICLFSTQQVKKNCSMEPLIVLFSQIYS